MVSIVCYLFRAIFKWNADAWKLTVRKWQFARAFLSEMYFDDEIMQLSLSKGPPLHLIRKPLSCKTLLTMHWCKRMLWLSDVLSCRGCQSRCRTTFCLWDLTKHEGRPSDDKWSPFSRLLSIRTWDALFDYCTWRAWALRRHSGQHSRHMNNWWSHKHSVCLALCQFFIRVLKSTEICAQIPPKLHTITVANTYECISQMHRAMSKHVLHFSDCFVLRLWHIAPRESEEEDKTGGKEQHWVVASDWLQMVT